MPAEAPPRLYCIPAARAPVVAVCRRGPSDWAHVGRWDLAAWRYDPGAWLGGRLFPRRCDLSPDGQFLSYFAHKPSADWEHGATYVAISKLPWLTALHAFGTCGTWTRGYHFTDDPSDVVDDTELPLPFGLEATRPEQFATERRRGWVESADSPPRAATDHWDEQRHARLEKPQPSGSWMLHVESAGRVGGEFHAQSVDGIQTVYWLTRGDGELTLLDDVQWADWSPEGLLLVATRAGALEARDLAHDTPPVVFAHDLARLQPEPRPAPDWAQAW